MYFSCRRKIIIHNFIGTFLLTRILVLMEFTNGISSLFFCNIGNLNISSKYLSAVYYYFSRRRYFLSKNQPIVNLKAIIRRKKYFHSKFFFYRFPQSSCNFRIQCENVVIPFYLCLCLFTIFFVTNTKNVKFIVKENYKNNENFLFHENEKWNVVFNLKPVTVIETKGNVFNLIKLNIT